MSKLAVVFPGIGYTADKPLLYYSRKIAAECGYDDIRVIAYTGFPAKILGDREKMTESYRIALKQSGEMLADTDFSSYDEVLFIGKSIGTAVAAQIAAETLQPVQLLLYTPLEETFRLPLNPEETIAFHGTGDPWASTEEIVRVCGEKGIPLYLTKKANHSLERGIVKKDLKTIRRVMRTVEEFV